MPLLGNIVVIKRNGTDGLSFPLTESSCLFGRRPECDIRIHLPQVSKEHCKIEVNENKEAILTNLSTANPTKLNGGCFQQPVPLKHGDVLTILDRSFRFEYPLQSTLRKRRSRSPKDETLQVLHLQQVAEVESCKQTPGSKNIRVSDNAECEEKNANENKQAREENISKTLPIKLSTPKSLYRPHQSVKQKGMSPFSKLYEKLKSEFIVQKPLQGANAPQQAAKEDAKNVLLEPSAPISSSSCVQDLGSLTKEKEKGRRENTEEYKITMKQDTNSSELNQISTGGSAAKKSFTRTPQTSASKQVLGSTGRRSHFRNHKELSTTGGSKDSELPVTPSKENDGNAWFLLEQCSIECLDSAGKTRNRTSATHKPAQTSTANVYEADVLTTPTSRRKGPRSHCVSPTSEASGMNPVTADTPTSRCRLSLKRKSLSEALAETQQENSASRNGDLSQQPLAEDKCLKQNSEQHTPGKPVKEVVKEVCDQADFVDSKDGYCDTPAPLPNIKSSRRSNSQSKELPDKNVYSETLASEKVISELASPAGQKSGSGRKKGRPRSSGLLTEKALEASAVEEHHKETTGRKDSGTREELTTEECHQKQDKAGASDTRPRRLSSKRRSSGSAAVLKDSETVSEMNISGLLAGEESGKKKSICQKRKSGDTLLQPLGKRKRVSFGGHLSPELFDKSLPPNSPLKKGATPARLSLPFGNSPRAVLKKTQGLKHFAVQELQKEKMSPKTVSAQKSPAASAPISGKATLNFTSGSPAPYKKGRFSVSLITPPLPIAEEQEAIEEGVNTEEKGAAQVTTPKSSRINQDDKTSLTPEQLIRNAQPALKATPMRRRSGAVATIKSKRRSGASNANLLVAKSWAEVVKLGVAKPQMKTVKKSVQKGRSLKKTTQSSKTPERKIKGHFSTGHAESPATIVVGRAYSTAVRTSGRVPKVVKNPLWKLNMNMDESFTGMTEMFQTPESKSAKALPLVAVQKTDVTPICPAEEISELHTPEETGEMMVSPLNSSDASERKQDSPSICRFLRETQSLTPVFDAMSVKTPNRRKALLEENISVDGSSIIPEKQTSQVKLERKKRTPKQKLEPPEVTSGIEQLFRTPKKRSEPVEALSGIKQLMKTPKQKSDLVEALSGIKQLLKTPEQKLEPVEILSGIKQLLRTPKRKMEPVEVLSGIKRLLRTPKQKSEPVEVLSGIKQLMRTPQQKPEPVEVLSGIKQLMRTPQQKPEPVEVLSGIKQLMRTPQQKPEPVEVLSGIKQLMRSPQEELDPYTDEIAFERLLKTPLQKREAAQDVACVNLKKKTPRMKYQPVEDMIGVSRIFKSPKEKAQPIEDMFGISRLVKTPREKQQPVDDFVGLQRLMAEPRQKHADFEVDYAGVTEMFDAPEEIQVRPVNVVNSKQEDTAPLNSTHECGGKKTPAMEDKGNTSQDEDTQQTESTSEDQSTQTTRRGRPRKRAHPASAQQSERDLNSKELQELETKSAKEEAEEISTSTSVPKKERRERRTNRCIQEEVVSDQEKVETVSPRGATQRPGRGKRKGPEVLKHLAENLDSHSKDSSVVQIEPADMKQTLKECGINDVLKAEDDPATKAESVSSSIQNESSQLPTDFKNPESKSKKGSVENSEEMLLLPGRRTRGVREVNTEPQIPSKRGRRARNEQVNQASSEDLQETTRKLRKGPSAKAIQRGEQAFDRDTEAATARESEHGAKLEMKVAETKVKSLRSARKISAEAKKDVCATALENTNIQKTEETSTETQSHINGIKVSQGDETENAQENTTEASQISKAESPSGETNRARSRRGKKDSLEEKADESGKGIKNTELITPKSKSETEMNKSCEGSLGSVCAQNTDQVKKEKHSPHAITVCAENRTSLAHGLQKQTRNQQGILKAKHTEILQENQAQANQTMLRRGRGRKVNFQLEEDSSKVVEGKRNLPEDDKVMTCKDSQHETSEKLSPQVKRSRRKQVDSIPQTASSTFMQTLIADDNKDEAFVKEQDSAVEATPSSTEDIPLRRGRRREVAAAPQTSRSLSIGKRRGLLEGDDKKMTVQEDQTSALGNRTLQAKANASARDRRKKTDLAAEAKSSSSLQGKCGLSETGDKEEATSKEHNVPLETVSCAKEKSVERGKRRGKALAPHTTNYISLRGKCGLPADSGKEEAPKEDQNALLDTSDSSAKENKVRRGRRKEIAFLLEATSTTSTQGKRGLSKERGRKNNCREANQLILEDSASQESMDLSKGNSKQTMPSPAVSSSSLQVLPEDAKNETPEENQNILLDVEPPAKDNRSQVGRKKTTSSKSEQTSSTSLREKPGLPRGRGQKRILQEGGDASLENNSPQEKTRQLRNKRRNIELTSEAATSTSLHTNGDLPEKKTTSSKSEQTSSTFLREKPGLPRGRGQKRILQEGGDASLENNSPQEKTRQLRNKRRNIELTSEAATTLLTSGDLPENGNASETQNLCLTSTSSENSSQSGEGEDMNLVQQAASTSRRRKCPLPADGLAPKKLKSGSEGNGSLQKGRTTKEELGKEDMRTAGGTDRKTRSSARTRK